MSHATPSEADLANTLSHLKVSTHSKNKPSTTSSEPKSKKSEPVADSWEDSLSLSSGSDTETEPQTTKDSDDAEASLSRSTTSSSGASLSPIKTAQSYEPPNPPPPTPASPTRFDYPISTSGLPYGATDGRRGSGAGTPTKRPEKTTAVAGRMIAGALGVKAPKRTEEEREFDRAMREKERRRRDTEREREKKEREELEKRKKAIWDD